MSCTGQSGQRAKLWLHALRLDKAKKSSQAIATRLKEPLIRSLLFEAALSKHGTFSRHDTLRNSTSSWTSSAVINDVYFFIVNEVHFFQYVAKGTASLGES